MGGAIVLAPQNDGSKYDLEGDCETITRAVEIVEDDERLKAVQEHFALKRHRLEELSKSEFLKKIGFR